MPKKMRVSKAVHYCSKHGEFKGYRWNGHRVHCKEAETTAQNYHKSIKLLVGALGKKMETATESKPVLIGYPRTPKLIMKDLRDKVKELDLKVNRLGVQIRRHSRVLERTRSIIHSIALKKQEMVMEKSKIISGIEQLLK